MKTRYLWLLAGTALSFSLLSIGYLCAVAPASVQRGTADQIMAAASVPAEVSLPEDGEGCMVQTFDGEICVIRNGTVLPTGLSDSLLPSQDRQALEDGIPVEDDEALAALLEDLGS